MIASHDAKLHMAHQEPTTFAGCTVIAPPQVAFAYPIPEVQPIARLMTDAIQAFLALGGHVYMDDAGRVLRVNSFAVTDFYKGRAMYFAAPAPLPSAAVAALGAAAVMQPPTHLAEVLFGVLGMQSIAWLPDRAACERHGVPPFEHGAFVALYRTALGARGVAMPALCTRRDVSGALWFPPPAPAPKPRPGSGRPASPEAAACLDAAAVRHALRDAARVLAAGTPAQEDLLWREVFAAAGTDAAGRLHRRECRAVVGIVRDHLPLVGGPGRFETLFLGLDDKRRGFLLEDEFVHVMQMFTMHAPPPARDAAAPEPRALAVWPVAEPELALAVHVPAARYTLTYPTAYEDTADFEGPLSAVAELAAPAAALGVPADARFVCMAYPVPGAVLSEHASADVAAVAEWGALVYLPADQSRVLHVKILLPGAGPSAVPGEGPAPLYLSAPIAFPPLYIKKYLQQPFTEGYRPLARAPAFAPAGTSRVAWLGPNHPVLTDLGLRCPHGGFLLDGGGEPGQDCAYVLMCPRWQTSGPEWQRSNAWKREVRPLRPQQKILSRVRSADIESLELDGQVLCCPFVTLHPSTSDPPPPPSDTPPATSDTPPATSDPPPPLQNPPPQTPPPSDPPPLRYPPPHSDTPPFIIPPPLGSQDFVHERRT